VFSNLSQSESELLAIDSQSVRLGLEPLLVCVCVSTVSLSRLCPVCLILTIQVRCTSINNEIFT
jgi:hypothetical protein